MKQIWYGDREEGDRPRLLPPVLVVPEGRAFFLAWFAFASESSLKVNKEDEGCLPALLVGEVPVCLTSRIACAPKLNLRAKDGLGGVFMGGTLSSSSMTALSSKLFLNSGLPADELDMLARRCLEKLLYGVSWLLPPPESPRAMEMLLFLCIGTPGDGATALEGEVDIDEELPKARGFNISTKDFRLEFGGGETVELGSDMLVVFGLKPLISVLLLRCRMTQVRTEDDSDIEFREEKSSSVSKVRFEPAEEQRVVGERPNNEDDESLRSRYVVLASKHVPCRNRPYIWKYTIRHGKVSSKNVSNRRGRSGVELLRQRWS